MSGESDVGHDMEGPAARALLGRLIAADRRWAQARVQRCTKPVGDLRIDVGRVLGDNDRPSRAACEAAADDVRGIDGVDLVTVIPPRLYVRLSAAFFSNAVADAVLSRKPGYAPIAHEHDARGDRVIVSFSNPNANKPLHLGHLRNNFLGMAIANLLAAQGLHPYRVERLSDWGIHLCHALLGILTWPEGDSPEAAGLKGDHFVGRHLVRFHQANHGEPAEDSDDATPLERQARELLVRLDAGDPPLQAAHDRMTQWVRNGFRETYERIGTLFDDHVREADGLIGVRALLAQAVIDGTCQRRADGSVFIDLTNAGLWDVTLLRGDGTATVYAQQLGAMLSLWERMPVQRTVVVFGRDWEEPFKATCALFARLGLPGAADIEGISHGMVGMPDGRMRSRYGNAVTADGLLDTVRTDLVARWPGRLPASWFEDQSAREQVAVGLVKYYLLRVERSKDVVYDEEQLWDGVLPRFAALVRTLTMLASRPRQRQVPDADLRPLLQVLDAFPETVRRASDRRDPVLLVRFVDDVCRHVAASGVELGSPRVAEAALLVLRRALDLLGIDLPSGITEEVGPQLVGTRPTLSGATYDIVGIGAGPSNLSLAALADPLAEVSTRFFESSPDFQWHPGLMVKDARLQIAFLKDLVTPVDPTNPHSFLNFLATTGRLYRFLMTNPERIPRMEYSQYFRWVASRLPNIEFGCPVTNVTVEATAIALYSGNRFLGRTNNLVMGTGKAPKVPEFAKPLLGSRVMHSSSLLDVAPAGAGRRVLVVGGGQSGAEVVRHFLSGDGGLPARLAWVTSRLGFLPMDDSPFSNEWFNPRYVAHFVSLSAARRAEVLANQMLASDGISEELLEEIYRRLYELDYFEGRPLDYMLVPASRLLDLRDSDRDVLATLRSEETGEVQDLGFDVVVLCTGYEDRLPDALTAVDARLHREDDRIVVRPDYSVAWDGPSNCRVFVQNMAKHSHGIADPNLSLTAWRSAVILNAVVGTEIYGTARDDVTTTWRPQRTVDAETEAGTSS
ncbi:MAG: lysine N6-hydroxylase [Acidimicrobiaceae bacterium]|nr:lysine N6-hydroxylase [Acidimicrobiaceae bacterium]